jgi:hypothetical protein
MGQAGIEFLAAAANGIDVQSGDACDGGIAAMADFLGFEAGYPATLLFIKPLKEQIHLFVQLSFRMVRAVETSGALALMNWGIVHDWLSVTVLSAVKHAFCS